MPLVPQTPLSGPDEPAIAGAQAEPRSLQLLHGRSRLSLTFAVKQHLQQKRPSRPACNYRSRCLGLLAAEVSLIFFQTLTSVP